jgi:uncharacterized membrane protein
MVESRRAGAHASLDGSEHLPKGVAALGAALFGLGVVFWVAANWQHWGRMPRFALLQGALLAFSVGAALRPDWRTPLAVAAFLTLGGLLAFFGQTYQTGADPWSLFAVCAALALPLCGVARRDALWAAWGLVALTGVSLWQRTWQGASWSVAHTWVLYVAWGMSMFLCLALHPGLGRWSGAGRWAYRVALLLTLLMLGSGAVDVLFGKNWLAPWLLAMLCLVVLTVATLLADKGPDLVALSALALLANTLIVGALAHMLFEGHDHGDPIVQLLLLGLVATGLLAFSVTAILRIARVLGAEELAA